MRERRRVRGARGARDRACGPGQVAAAARVVRKVHEQGSALILIARADPVGAGSSLLLVRQLVRQAGGTPRGRAGSRTSTPRLRAHVGRASARRRTPPGSPTSSASSSASRRATDPASSSGRRVAIRGSWLRGSRGPSASGWRPSARSDRCSSSSRTSTGATRRPSRTSGDALDALAARPLMVLALARPDLHETFPNVLGARRETSTSASADLPPRAAERLVTCARSATRSRADCRRHVSSTAPTATRSTSRSSIRASLSDEGDALPETVLALVQSRIERLEGDARRMLRAASVFGQVFWRGGVGARCSRADGSGADLRTPGWTTLDAARAHHPRAGEPVHRRARVHLPPRPAARGRLRDAHRRRPRDQGIALAGAWLEARGREGCAARWRITS